jgi:branched-chain amino acid transport system permease protein
MNYFIQLLISGLAVGAIYGLVAMGFAVIYKATGIVNFAQGEMGMLSAYTTWSLATMLGTGSVATVRQAPSWSARRARPASCERLIMRPMLGEPVLSVVMVTVGLAVVLRSIVTIIWDASPHKFEVAGRGHLVSLGGIGLRT